MYGIQVQDCVAETISGRKLPIILGGCTLDEVIISNIQYTPNVLQASTDETFSNSVDTSKAFADAMAFKFPDSEEIWIICSIKLCLQPQLHLKTLDEKQTKETMCPTKPLVK